jgi:hypothetical protein
MPRKAWQKKHLEKITTKTDLDMKLNLNELLGIPLLDIAIILKTTRTQLSMFELGQRDIPTKSKILLADILKFIQQEKENAENNASILKEETIQSKSALEAMLKKNKYDQFLLDKKFKAAEKKRRKAFTALLLANYLEKNKDKDDILLQNMDSIVRNGALSNLKKTNQALITELQIKKEVLQAEEKILLEHLKKEK